MKLVTFRDEAGCRIGIFDPLVQVVIDLSVVAPGAPRDMLELIDLGPESLSIARQALDTSIGGLPLASIELLAPIPRPRRNIFCVGKNYRDHAEEFHGSGYDTSTDNTAIPNLPIVFTKPPSAVIGPQVPIPASLDPTHSVDYENELTVVIGKGGRSIPKKNAFDHIFGYTIVNDVTSRVLQKRHQQWFLGKGIDGFCPMGPAITTHDEIADIGSLHLITRVNGEIRQDAMVRDLIFDVPTLIEVISACVTLEPGDLIATGTPAGVGVGFVPPRYLQKGDVTSLSIEPLGELINPVN